MADDSGCVKPLETGKALTMSVTGVVKWYDSEKGYGFIKPQDGSKDVFLHVSQLKRSRVDGDLGEGDLLMFETEDSPNGKGLRAINISRAD